MGTKKNRKILLANLKIVEGLLRVAPNKGKIGKFKKNLKQVIKFLKRKI